MKFKITTSHGRTLFSNEESEILAEKYADLHEGEEIAAIEGVNITVKEVISFKASDGVIFEKQEQAKKREAYLALVNWIEKEVSSIDANAVLTFFENLTSSDKKYLIYLLEQM